MDRRDRSEKTDHETPRRRDELEVIELEAIRDQVYGHLRRRWLLIVTELNSQYIYAQID